MIFVFIFVYIVYVKIMLVDKTRSSEINVAPNLRHLTKGFLESLPKSDKIQSRVYITYTDPEARGQRLV